MSLLTIAQTCAKRLQITSPSAVIGNTDNNMVLLLAMIEDGVQNIRNEFLWPELQREWLFYTIPGVDAYPLPGDFNNALVESVWNRTQKWPLLGPVDASSWQTYKSGLVPTLPRQRYRIKGFSNNQFFIDPTPTVSELCVQEYISRNVIRPKKWVANTAYLFNDYVFSNGLFLKCLTNGTSSVLQYPEFGRDGTVFWTSIPGYAVAASYNVGQYIYASPNAYKCTVAGVCGAAPTHTSGSATSGTCTFLYVGTPSAWVAGTTYATGALTIANPTPDCYLCAVPGVSGQSSPKFRSVVFLGAGIGVPTLPTFDTITDSTTNWLLQYQAFESFTADTDEVVLDNQMIIDEAVWKFLQIRGFDYAELMKSAQEQKDILKTNLSGTGVVSVSGQGGVPPCIGQWSYPIGNFGI